MMNTKFRRIILISAVVLLFSMLFCFNASALGETGTYGDDVRWKFNSETGELVISGTGYMMENKNHFSGNTDIKSVVFEPGVINIAYKAFENCKNLKSIIIPDSVMDIGPDAFSGCESLENITIPDSVTSIGGSAFENCKSLENITIPDSVKSIYAGAFEETAYYKNESNWENGVLYIGNHLVDVNDNITDEYIVKDGTLTIADSAFCDLNKLKSITIPDSVISIGYMAFYNCTSLESVTLGNGLKKIGNDAFQYCKSLNNIRIPDSVTDIGDNAFGGCKSLLNITIPDSVTRICGAFWGTAYCENESNWENGVLYIGNHLIEADDNISDEYIVKEGTVTIADSAFYYKDNLKSITLPDSLISIGEGAFESCDALENVTFGNGLKKIENDAFRYCESLKSITIPDGVTDIGDNAFNSCKSLANITLPDSVKSIGSRAFENTEYYKNKSNWENSALYIGKHLIREENVIISDYEIKEGTITIADWACKFMISLENVTVPDSVVSIGEMAFYGCLKLGSITIRNPLCEIYDCYNTIHDGKSGYKSKFNSFIIYGYSGSTAQAYAEKYYKTFIALDKEEEPDTPVAEHKHTEAVVPGKEATCTKAGLTDGKKCTVCGEVTAEQITIPATGHKVTTLKAVKATYTKTGLTAGEKCKVCGKVTVKQKKVAKKKLKKATISSVKSTKKKLATVAWKKTTDASGYIVEYSTSKKFTSKTTKKVTIKNGKTVKATLKKLKSGKKYYVRVKAYRTEGKKTVYGSYSTVKTVKVK